MLLLRRGSDIVTSYQNVAKCMGGRRRGRDEPMTASIQSLQGLHIAEGWAIACTKIAIDIAHNFVMAAQAASHASLALPARRGEAVAASKSRYYLKQSVCCSMRGRP
jgi:hypothetical protein